MIAFLPGLASLQPMDRDEPRFAQASKQMLETGDLVDIRFQGEAPDRPVDERGSTRLTLVEKGEASFSFPEPIR